MQFESSNSCTVTNRKFMLDLKLVSSKIEEKDRRMPAIIGSSDISDRISSHISFRSMSTTSWASASAREFFRNDAFQTYGREYDDEEALIWAAIDRLPTYDRVKRGILQNVLDDGKIVPEQVDFTNLGYREKQHLIQNVPRVVGEDNEKFLQRLRERTDRVGIEIPKVEVRYEHLSIEGDTYAGSRAQTTLLNSVLNVIEGIFEKVKIIPSKKRPVKMLHDLSGIVKPSRMTLLLGPPGSGKTTFLKALAGELDKDLRVSGRITYCGNEMSDFIPQKTCSYISQHDLHHGEMTVRETLDFSGRCLGVGTRDKLLQELSRREKKEGIERDPEIDSFMKATAVAGQESSLVTDYVIKILGLDICADILVGDEMRRGISGGQKKRLTTGEMLVGPAKVFYMDGISTGLDCSTTFQIVNYMRQMVHIMDVTMIISLLQPAPEIFELFDDVMLLTEGQIVYQGPRQNILEFFESVGFKCPERKGVADFVQEVISKRDQALYWFKRDEPYRYISVGEFVQRFNSFHIGQNLQDELSLPYDKTKTHPAALVTEKYGISNMELFKACLSREWLLMKRNSLLYVFKTFQITVMAIFALTVFFRTKMPYGQLVYGGKFYGALFFSLLNVMFNGVTEMALIVMRLPVFYKQRDSLLYPAWAFSLPIWLLKIPLSLMESLIWIILTYYPIGFAPGAMHQMGLSLFRFVGAIGRTQVVANSLATFSLLVVFVMGGFVISKDDLPKWLTWAYYATPMMYGQNALAMNEFLDDRWSTPINDTMFIEPTVGRVLLRWKGMFLDDYMYWMYIAALFAFSFLFNILFILALTYLNPLGTSKSVAEEDNENKKRRDSTPYANDTRAASTDSNGRGNSKSRGKKKGMVLPFTPLSLAFNNVNYYVDMPAQMKNQGIRDTRLQLLRDVSGSFRPGVLTALVGVSGAGKTTLMDVLAGRKTGGYVEGSINISGYPKHQATFSRISGYCEQNDIHSPHVTVYESVVYSAWLRLSPEVNKKTRKMFVDEVMDLIELKPLSGALVGLPGVNGLSTEQRRRVTIAVELVANPSIIFMDEPTSGLDARAAAIVMRTVRNTVDTGRTVVCTIHQPSIDIFESFDELLLMKRGGEVIYAGPLGHNSHQLVQYFRSVPGVPDIKEDQNPATWMLDITTPSMETQLGFDFARRYANSELYRRNQEQIKLLSTPVLGSNDLHFPTKYAQTFVSQCKACFWKQHLSYWRNSQYNAIRFFLTTIVGILFGVIYWHKGKHVSREQDLLNLLGAMYSAIMFLGGTNTSAIQSVVAVERTVFYREKAAGMYSALPYAFAQVAIEIVYLLMQTFLYSFILYSMIGFPWIAANFFWFYYYIFMCFTYFTLYGMMLVALTPNYMIAAVIMTFFLSFWNLFSGFLVPRTQIPIWWRWYYWGSPVSWTLYGVITSQVGNMNESVEVLGLGNIQLPAFLELYLGFKYDFLGFVALAHVGWAVLFCVIFVFSIKYLNFQRR